MNTMPVVPVFITIRQGTHTGEIVFWGEKGAIGTPPRLQLIRDEILKLPEIQGWQSHDYLVWYDVYDKFLKEHGFTGAFPTVGDLTREIGNVSFYYQGWIIENIRMKQYCRRLCRERVGEY